MPGKAYAKRKHVWLSSANEVDSKNFSRAILAKVIKFFYIFIHQLYYASTFTYLCIHYMTMHLYLLIYLFIYILLYISQFKLINSFVVLWDAPFTSVPQMP